MNHTTKRKTASILKNCSFRRFLGLSALLPLLLTGCGSRIAPGYPQSQPVSSESPSDQSVNTKASETDASSQNTSSGSAKDIPFTEKELTQDELRQFTDFINEHDNKTNYGFLLSEYSRPQEADLNEILYNGIGESPSPITDQEREAYSKATGQTIDSDCTKLSTKMIDEFLKAKMNLTMEDITSDFNWVYLKDFDNWFFVHGDTNYTTFTCVSGKQTEEDLYELEFASNSEFYQDCRVTLRKAGDSYQFVSNEYIPQIKNRDYVWLIEEQTFDVNLNDWGDVTFASYEPNYNENPTGDASFALMQDGKAVFQFPAVFKDNIIPNAAFDGIEAVGFKDYNQDGYLDVVIICRYAHGSGPDAAVVYNQLRLYRGESKDFLIDGDLSDLVNSANQNTSVKEAVQYIQATYPGGYVPRLE